MNPDNTLCVVSGQILSGGVATCWVVTDGQDALVSNAGSGDSGACTVMPNGALQPYGIVATVPPAIQTPPGQSVMRIPIDLAASQDDRFVCAINSGSGQVLGYQVGTSTGLSLVTRVQAGKPQSGIRGIAAYRGPGSSRSPTRRADPSLVRVASFAGSAWSVTVPWRSRDGTRGTTP